MNQPLNVKNLILMQDGFRLPCSEIYRMADHVQDGKTFVECQTPIAIVDFGDELLYIRDGLHRIASIFIGRSDQLLYPEEYVLEKMNYSDYIYPNIKNGWYTPHNPKTHVRAAQLGIFKEAIGVLLENGYSHKDVEDYIERNRPYYIRKRIPYKHDSIEWFVNEMLKGEPVCQR